MHCERWFFIGDSLVEFFDWQIRFPRIEALNLGMAGETVEGLLERLDQVIDRLAPPDKIFIMTGTNNVAMEDYGFIGSYEKIIQTLIGRVPRSRVIVTSLLPIQLPWLAENAIPRINAALREMSRKEGLSFLNIYQRFTDDRYRTDRAYFLEDGVHLTDYGYEAWAQAITDFLNDS